MKLSPMRMFLSSSLTTSIPLRRGAVRDAIIDRLHGPGFAITDRTIDSHVRNLRGKFANLGGHDVVETRAGVGYRLQPVLPGGGLRWCRPRGLTLAESIPDSSGAIL